MRCERATVWLACCAVGLLGAGCGSQVARQTGTIQGSLPWTGTWPQEGAMLVVLFDLPPWSPDFEPGPPVAYTLLTRPPDGGAAPFAIDSPGVAFGTYGALTAAWQDPEAQSQSEHMRPVAAWGTQLDRLEEATPVELSRASPDLTVTFESVELFGSAAEMRTNYPPVAY